MEGEPISKFDSPEELKKARERAETEYKKSEKSKEAAMIRGITDVLNEEIKREDDIIEELETKKEGDPEKEKLNSHRRAKETLMEVNKKFLDGKLDDFGTTMINFLLEKKEKSLRNFQQNRVKDALKGVREGKPVYWEEIGKELTSSELQIGQHEIWRRKLTQEQHNKGIAKRKEKS